MDPALENFLHFQDLMVEQLEGIDDAVGLMFAGSSAALNRVDRFSDHDFYLVVKDGTAESFRQNLSWLPSHQDIVLSPRETEHGLKVLYSNGRLLEFAVFEEGELSHHIAPIDNAVVLDKTNVAEVIRQITIASEPKPINPEDEFALFLTLLQIGAGRVMRGEVIAGSQHIKVYALGRLMKLIRHFEPPAKSKADVLDVFRRFEFDHPENGKLLGMTLEQPPLHAAQTLLEVAEGLAIAKSFEPAIRQIRNYLVA